MGKTFINTYIKLSFKKIGAFTLLCLPISLLAQQNFVYHYGMDAFTNIQLEEAPGNKHNGDIIMAGTSSKDPEGVFCISFNSAGEPVWSKSIEQNKKFSDLLVDGNGRTLLTGRENPGIFIHCLNSSGKSLWRKKIQGKSNLIPEKIMLANDGGYFIYAVKKISNNPSKLKAALIKVSIDGVLEWSGSYFTSSVRGSAKVTKEGNILLAQGDKIIKTNPNGEVIWSKKMNSSFPFVTTIKTLGDGSAVIHLNKANEGNFTLLKIDDKGEILWQIKDFIYPGTGGDYETFDLALTSDSGFLLSGRVNPQDINPRNLPALLKVDKNGKFEFFRYFKDTASPSPLYSGAYSIINYRKSDVYFMAGKKSHNYQEAEETLFLKANSLNEENHCISALPFNSKEPEKVTFEGSSVDKKEENFTITNTGIGLNNFSLSRDVVCIGCVAAEVDLGADKAFCEGDSVILETGNKYSDHEWSTGATGTSIVVKDPGLYWVETSNNCGVATDTVQVKQFPEISAEYDFYPKEPDPGEEIQFVDSSAASVNEKWIFGDSAHAKGSKVTHSYNSTGKFPFQFYYEDNNGCKYAESDTIKVFFYRLFIPNAFSPNGDGENEVFAPKGYGIKRYHLRIYNRWGQKVFDGKNEGWDGTVGNKKAAKGQYVYELTVKNVYKDEINKKGVLKLIR